MLGVSREKNHWICSVFYCSRNGVSNAITGNLCRGAYDFYLFTSRIQSFLLLVVNKKRDDSISSRFIMFFVN